MNGVFLGVFLDSFLGVFWTVTFFGEVQRIENLDLQEGLKRGENWIL